MNRSQMLGYGAISSLIGVILLVIMVIIGFGSKDALALLGEAGTNQIAYQTVVVQGTGVITVLAVDNIFVIAYTGAFLGVIALVWSRARLIGASGLFFVLLLALFDFSENVFSINLINTISAGIIPPPGEFIILDYLSSTKYLVSTIGIALLGVGMTFVALPRRNRALATLGLFLAFPVINALAVANPSLATLRIVWMLVMLAGVSLLLWYNTPVLTIEE